MKKLIYLLSFLVLFSCKKEIENTVVYDNIIYKVNDVDVYTSNAEKTKQKTPELLLSIMYSDIFNQSISTTRLLQLAELSLAIGDKTMFSEMILSQFLANPTALIPTNTQMRANTPQFVEESYIRFFQRKPSEYEKIYLTNLITNDNLITVNNVFTSFVLSNEYYFY